MKSFYKKSLIMSIIAMSLNVAHSAEGIITPMITNTATSSSNGLWVTNSSLQEQTGNVIWFNPSSNAYEYDSDYLGKTVVSEDTAVSKSSWTGSGTFAITSTVSLDTNIFQANTTLNGTNAPLNKLKSVDTVLTIKDGVFAKASDLAAIQNQISQIGTGNPVEYDDTTKGKVTLGGANGTGITNLTAGAVTATSTDAVNGSQLYGAANSVKDALGGSAVVNPDGTVKTSNVGGTGQDTVDGAIAAIKDQATKAKSTVSAGANTVVASSANEDGSTNYKVSMADAVVLSANGSLTAGSTKLDGATGKITGLNAGAVTATSKDGVNGSQLYGAANSVKDALGGSTVVNPDGTVKTSNVGGTGQDTVDGAIAALNDGAVKYDDATKGKVTMGGGANGTTITNVKPAALTATSTDAVNGGQLFATNQNVSTLTETVNKGLSFAADMGTNVHRQLGDTVAVVGDGNITTKTTTTGVQVTLNKVLTVDSVTMGNTVVNSNGLTIAGGASVTNAGVDAGGKAITNVAAGTADTDAVNVAQLKGVANALSNDVNKLEKNLSGRVASAIAMESAPYVVGKTTYYAGVGVSGGVGAIGVSLRKTAENGRWSISGGISAAQHGGVSARIGLTGIID